MAQEKQNNEDQKHKEQPIIIKKVKKGGGGHHGGAWKVAYADFVTAMMAFFIVMWILASSEEIKENVAAYFSDPFSYSVFTGKPIGEVPVDIKIKNLKQKRKTGESDSDSEGDKEGALFFDFKSENEHNKGNPNYQQAVKDSITAAKRVGVVQGEIEDLIKDLMSKKPEMKDILSSIKIEMTKEGLRIELIETSESLFFKVGSNQLTQEAVNVLKQIAGEIGKLPNRIVIEGHTDSRGYSTRSDYTNWNLSADRANAARKILVKRSKTS